MQLRGVHAYLLFCSCEGTVPGGHRQPVPLLLLSCLTGHPPVGGWMTRGPAQSRPPGGELQYSWGSNGVMCGRAVISGTNSLVIEEVELASAQGRELAVRPDVVFAPGICSMGSCSVSVDCPRKASGGSSLKVGLCVGLLCAIGLVKRQPNAPQMTKATWRRFRGKDSSNRLTARIPCPFADRLTGAALQRGMRPLGVRGVDAPTHFCHHHR
ncbi:hypothetical protein H4V95_000326 [Arthrobacter sp. CAN_C5]|nr:hypothetical protein [Arthrobacter sp. CAN_C5]